MSHEYVYEQTQFFGESNDSHLLRRNEIGTFDETHRYEVCYKYQALGTAP